MLLAHPVTESVQLGVAPAVVACGVALLVAAAVRIAASTARPGSEGLADAAVPAGEVPSPDPRRRVVGQSVGAAVLVVAVVAGRLGDPDQFDNLATALVIGAGWPLLLLVTALVGDVWSWIDPFAGLARPIDALAGGSDRADRPGTDPVGTDRPGLDAVAVGGAVLVSGWLALHLGGLQPRAVGLGIGLYAVAVVSLCLAVGRRQALGRAEVVGVLLRALGAGRAGRPRLLSAWHRRAFAVLLGGLAFAELRFSSWYLSDVAALGLDPGSTRVAGGGYLIAIGLALASVAAARRWASRGSGTAAVDAVLPWLVCAAGLGAAAERDRLWTSAQLLVVRASDPLGSGANLFATADLPVLVWPFGDVWRLALQLVLIAAPAAAGAALVVRRTGRGPRPRPARTQPAVALAVGWVLVLSLSAATL